LARKGERGELPDAEGAKVMQRTQKGEKEYLKITGIT
jgi:hypothetical protein